MRGIVGTLAVPVLVAVLGACSEAHTDNAVYKGLAAIMDELNIEWNAPDRPPTRGMNVSKKVCPTITLAGLETMTGDKSLSGNVEYAFYEKSLTYADNSRHWTITRPVSLTEKQVLMISVSPRDGCVAIYRHINWPGP